MNEAVIKKRIFEFSELISSAPNPSTGQKASGGTYLYGTSVKGLAIDDSLEHLCLQLKYLIFDLEATRRENHYLRQMLESRNKREGGPEPDKGPSWGPQ